MERPMIVLAVDGGATKTTMTLQKMDGRELFSATATGSNYQAIGRERVEQVFDALLDDAKKAVADRDIAAAVFAVAGIDTVEDERTVRSIVESCMDRSAFTARRLIVENDVSSALLGLADGQPASLLIAGTGAVCFSYDGTNIVRVGGWGHRTGDEGSGYWIGRQIAKAIFRAADGRAEPTRLTELVLEANQLGGIDALMNWLYREDYTNARLASFSSYLQQAIEQGDGAAMEIARRAADELALLATAVLRKAGYGGENHPFHVNGGVLKNTQAIHDLFADKVKGLFPAVQFELCEEKPIEYIVKRAENLARAAK
ncbi:MAG: N-acetylglucosamine kinase [Lysinibacillus sp.]